MTGSAWGLTSLVTRMKVPPFVPIPHGDVAMTDTDIVVQLPLFSPALLGPKMPRKQANLHTHWLGRDHLPTFVTECAPAMRILDLLGPLDWENLPERDLQRNWGQITISN